MDINVFSEFTYDNEDAWNDFIYANFLQHGNYNTSLELLGKAPSGYVNADMEDTKDGQFDWLQAHYRTHLQLSAELGLAGTPDLTDVDFNDPTQFYDWLKLHAQEHARADMALNL